MASYHIQINTGEKGEALEHAQYIAREGAFTAERYGAVEAHGHANFPAWARADLAAFWRASDEFERANGNTYREYELALPRELSPAARVALIERFAEQELGSTRPYQWAIHNGRASDGKEQPHVHLMFSDRQLDGIERGPEQFFKRYNAKNPQKGGARKFSYGADKEEAARAYEGIRERWATIQNQALEHAGVEARVDHRSLAAQGIRDREPELHRGPAVSGIEARGEKSEVGQRQREQRIEREQERAAVVAEVRVVTREEMALERVAVRERRELAREVTGEDLAAVLPLVEADRREQLGRAQAAAERRVERRQGLGIGGQLKEKLIAQARALRARIGRELGRVKEWVAERFAEPLERLKARARVVLGEVGRQGRGARTEEGLAVPTAPEVGAAEPKQTLEEIRRAGREQWRQERELAKQSDQASTMEDIRRQGREDWLTLRAEFARESSPAPQRAEAVYERERLASLSARELWVEIEKIRPPSVAHLVERDPSVMGARQALEIHQLTAAQALEAANRAAHQSHAWRQAHGVQAKLHDLGVLQAAYLVERAAAGTAAKRTQAEALKALKPAQVQLGQARSEAERRITEETAPARAQVAELRRLAREAAERERVVREFERLARSRAAQRMGFQDASADWQATPKVLRDAIERYNREPPEVQSGIRKELAVRPEKARVVEQAMQVRRERVRDLGQDYSL